MTNEGANPFIEDYDGGTEFEISDLGHLFNLPTKKSVYFTTQSLPVEFRNKSDFPNPWFYRTGIFGDFDSVIGRGASGVILSGDWFGKKAAFKFVEIGPQTLPKDVSDALGKLNERLSEMTWIQAAKGSKIVSFYGHYR